MECLFFGYKKAKAKKYALIPAQMECKNGSEVNRAIFMKKDVL
jgi:hypothetical protein